MNFLLFIFIFIFTITEVNSKSESYNYVGHHERGDGYYVKFSITNNKLIIGDSILNVSYEDCSNAKYKCMKIDDEFIFVPRGISRSKSGSFKSVFGNYKVFNNEPLKLPFTIEIDYIIIEIHSNIDYKIILFYSEERGIIAYKRVDKGNYKNGIVWLVSKCGLLADKSCFRLKINKDRHLLKN